MVKVCGRCVLLHFLSRDPDSKVIMPSIEDIQFYQEVIGAKYPIRDDVWEAANVIKLLSEDLGEGGA